MEDWFSEDLLPEARSHRPVGLLKSFEAQLLTGGAYSSCPSDGMADALVAAYGCRKPATIYNVFSWSDRQMADRQVCDRRDRSIPSIHWFSQTLGRGRGLEDLFAALPLVRYRAEVHVRGMSRDGYANDLAASLPDEWRGRVFFHDLVPHDRLLSRVMEHDIGFAGEMTYCSSRELTITNKIFTYQLGGLAVVASDTVGQMEVARTYPNAVAVYPSGDPVALAEHLDELLGSPERLQRAKNASLAACESVFCWEKQKHVLQQQVEQALGRH